jgi:hypothetical protein
LQKGTICSSEFVPKSTLIVLKGLGFKR